MDVISLDDARAFVAAVAATLDPRSRYVPELVEVIDRSADLADLERRLASGSRGARHAGADVFARMTLPQKLRANLVTNKTDFFREPKQLEALARGLLPGARGRFLVWSAGCSTGEEPYTLAMILAEHARANPGFNYAVLATDISTRVLDVAREGIYPEAVVAPVPAALRAAYLRTGTGPSAGLVRVVPALRGRVTFHRLNFMDGDYRVRDMFDVIFFRNVAIYFDKDVQTAVVGKLCRSLRPGGHVVTGQSESLAGLDLPLTQIAPAIYRRD